MGKARRAAQRQKRRQEELDALQAQIGKIDRRARTFAIWTLVLSTLAVAFQCWLLGVMYYNIDRGLYDRFGEDKVNALASILPMGAVSLGLMLSGVVLVLLFVVKKKAALSLIGCGAAIAGIGFFTYYVLQVAGFFPYDPTTGRGLNFAALLYNHFLWLLPLLLLIPAEVFLLKASKKRVVAEVLQGVLDTASTLSLDEESAIED